MEELCLLASICLKTAICSFQQAFFLKLSIVFSERKIVNFSSFGRIVLVSKHSFKNCHLCFSASICLKTAICSFQQAFFLKLSFVFSECKIVNFSSFGRIVLVSKHSYKNCHLCFSASIRLKTAICSFQQAFFLKLSFVFSECKIVNFSSFGRIVLVSKAFV